ncbi:hypothetical protein AcV7_001011 [Taiwanofungus camphoratus]|nr:hypothetical protein AcV7_001011 [Antrodia cinnamomea]
MGSIYRSIPEAGCDLARAHAMSLLFMVFALATLFDPKLPSYSVEAHEYYLLARLCLRCAPPLQDTTLTSVQCVIYMAQYLEMSDCEPAHSASHKAWLLIGFAVKLGHSIGLHLNGSRWKLDEDARQRRGRVFWQLFMQDTWISFGFGRPPSISLSFVDCEFPKDPDEKINEQGCKEWGFHHWTWQYTRLLHSVISTTFGAKTPQYSIVLEFDRKIRDFPIPDHLRPQCGQAEEPPHGTPIFMQRYLLMSCKESTLLSLHRPFFVQALSEQPQDLLRHRYGPSVMAIYRSAWRVIEGAKESYKHAGVVASRLGIIWSQCLAGGIVMCLLVTRAPSSPLASSSLTELDTLCDLFEQAACTCQIASNNLDVVHKLRRQGHETMNKSQSQNDAVMAAHELDRLGGKTHLLASTQEVPTACTLETARVNSVTVAPPVVPLPTEIIHPTIMHDLRAFEGLESADLSLFNFDLPSGSQAQPQSAPDIFEDIFSTQTFPTEPGPPVLDATWQAFVEQLGF